MNLAEQLNEKLRRTGLRFTAEQLGVDIKITIPTTSITGEPVTYESISYTDNIDEFNDIFEAVKRVRDYDSDLLNDITEFSPDRVAFRNCDYDGHTIILEKNITGLQKPFHILARDAKNNYQINQDVDLNEIKSAMSDIVPKIEGVTIHSVLEDLQLSQPSLKL